MNGVEPGDRAPNFTLPDQEGNKVKLPGFASKVVLYFYPKADTHRH